MDKMEKDESVRKECIDLLKQALGHLNSYGELNTGCELIDKVIEKLTNE